MPIEDSQTSDPTTALPYPREELAAMVQQAQRSSLNRHRLQVWALGVGLGLLALGLPNERLWGNMELPSMVAGLSSSHTYGILFPLGSALQALGFGAEQACYLLSALAYGLCLPALTYLLRSIGFQRGVSLWAATTCLLSGLGWIGATLPSDLTAGVLGATLLMANIFRSEERLPGGYLWRVSLTFLLAFLLRPENLLLLPATIWALGLRRTSRLGGPLEALIFCLVMGVTLLILLDPQSDRSKLNHLLDCTLAGRNGTLAGASEWIPAILGGLGIALFGVYSLLLGRRLPQESPPPSWLVPWCLVALAPVATGQVAWGPVAGFVLPAAAVGLADWLSRREESPVGLGMGSVLLLPQAMILLGVGSTFRAQDPLAHWSAMARDHLQPHDRVLTADTQRRYLAHVRWGLELVDWPVSDPAPSAAGRTVFLDVGSAHLQPWEGQILHPVEPVHLLRAGSMRVLPPGEAFHSD